MPSAVEKFILVRVNVNVCSVFMFIIEIWDKIIRSLFIQSTMLKKRKIYVF